MSTSFAHRTVRAAIAIAVMVIALPHIASAQSPTCWPESLRSSCEQAKGYFDSRDTLRNPQGSVGCDPKFYRCYAGEPIPITFGFSATNTSGGLFVGGRPAVRDIGEYLARVYRWAVPVAAILAVVVIMVAGLLWIVSGVAEQKATAQQWIRNALIGLLLALGSYVILQTINPDLVRLSLPRTMIVLPAELRAPADAARCSATNEALCRSNAKCEWVNNSCRTIPEDRGRAGNACTPEETCSDGARCVRTPEGMKCTNGQLGQPCAENVDCINSDGECENNLCRAPLARPNGQGCSRDSECVSEMCRRPPGSASLCVAGDESTPCATVSGSGNDALCNAQYYCPDTPAAHCTPKKPVATACEDNRECASDDCTDGVCW